MSLSFQRDRKRGEKPCAWSKIKKVCRSRWEERMSEIVWVRSGYQIKLGLVTGARSLDLIVYVVISKGV